MGDKPMLWGRTKDIQEPGRDLPLRIKQRLGSDYIPGYSEIVMANDLSQSKVMTSNTKEK